MTQDEITRMAREAGLDHYLTVRDFPKQLERFYELAYATGAAHEREACAKVCEDIDTEYEGEDVLATWCAASIRARGE